MNTNSFSILSIDAELLETIHPTDIIDDGVMWVVERFMDSLVDMLMS